MSCQDGHDDFGDLLEHEHEHGDHEPGTSPAEANQAPRRRLSVRQQDAVTLAWIPLADGGMQLARVLAAGNPMHAVIFPAIGGIAAGVYATIATHHDDDQFVHVSNPDEATRRGAVRRVAYWSAGMGTAWSAVAAATNPAWLYGTPQWVMVAGGIAFAIRAGVLRRRAPQPPPRPAAPRFAPEDSAALPRREPLAALPPPDPPELTDFRDAYINGEGAPLAGAHATLEPLPHDRGFLLHLRFPRGTPGSASQVLAPGFLAGVAKFYDRPAADVSGDLEPDRPSEASARIQVITAHAEANLAAHRAWDGNTTYDPRIGAITLGPFSDGTPARLRLNKPMSGAFSGVIAGVPDSGKTGTMHKILADAGQAVMCVRCHYEGTCERCEPERFFALWAMDPQMDPLGLWRGYADQMGWGPGGSLEILQLMTTAGINRSKDKETEEWWDRDEFGRPRRNVGGRGWFDPYPGCPQILGMLDEFPLLAGHDDPLMRAEALRCATVALTTLRKVGLSLYIGVQMMDNSQTGLREIRELAVAFNALTHRADTLSTFMAGITGDPTKLSRNEPGVGYLNSYDELPGTRFHTSAVPTHRLGGYTGPVVKDLAERILGMTFHYDQAVLNALEAYGIGHRQVVTEWNGLQAVTPAEVIGQLAETAETTAAATGTPADLSVAGKDSATLLAEAIAAGAMVDAPTATVVNTELARTDSPLRIRAAGGGGMATADLGLLRSVVATRKGVNLHEVMAETGMSAGVAEDGLSQLVAMRVITAQPTGDPGGPVYREA